MWREAALFVGSALVAGSVGAAWGIGRTLRLYGNSCANSKNCGGFASSGHIYCERCRAKARNGQWT